MFIIMRVHSNIYFHCRIKTEPDFRGKLRQEHSIDLQTDSKAQSFEVPESEKGITVSQAHLTYIAILLFAHYYNTVLA